MYLCQIQEVEPCIFYVTGSFFIVLLDTFMLNIVHSYILRCIWNMQNSSINVCIIYKIPYFKTGKLVAHYFYSPNLSTHARWRRSCQVWWAWQHGVTGGNDSNSGTISLLSLSPCSFPRTSWQQYFSRLTWWTAWSTRGDWWLWVRNPHLNDSSDNNSDTIRRLLVNASILACFLRLLDSNIPRV